MGYWIVEAKNGALRGVRSDLPGDRLSLPAVVLQLKILGKPTEISRQRVNVEDLDLRTSRSASIGNNTTSQRFAIEGQEAASRKSKLPLFFATPPASHRLPTPVVGSARERRRP